MENGKIDSWSTGKIPLGVARKESDDILKSTMVARKNNVQSYIGYFSYLTKVKNIEHNAVISKNEEIDLNVLCLILGPLQHTKYTKPFFTDLVYNPLLNNNIKKILKKIKLIL